MNSIHLDHLLTGHVFAFLFVFMRIGAILMLFPGIGETYVSPRIRMALALSLSFLLMGPLMPMIPAVPSTIAELMRLLSYELVIGLFFGTVLRVIMNVLETVGFMIGMQTGLSNAVILNPAQATQSPLVSAFLSIAGITLLFVTGLDRLLLRSMVGTYDVFPPGGVLQAGDMAQSFIQIFNESFVIGIELSIPFMVVGILMYVSLGIMQRLMPMVQLFLVILPVQIWGGLFLIAVMIGGIMDIWLQYADKALGPFLQQ